MKRTELNHRQHRFALNILAGMPPQEAYVKAGYSTHPGNLTGAPYQIVSDNPCVKAFIEEKRRLKEQIVLANSVNATLSDTVLSKEEKRSILATYARAQLMDLLNDNGEPVLDKKSPAAKALKEWHHQQKVDKNGNPIITKSMKLVDPIAAIMEDNKMMGHYAPSKHLHGVVRYNISFVKKGRNSEEMADGSATLTMQDTENGSVPVFHEER